MENLTVNEVMAFIVGIKPSRQAKFLHLMKMSLDEIQLYEQEMRKKYNGDIPAEIMQEVVENVKRHRQEFGKEGRLRKLILH